jgi:G:T-mismatch repair DNA endonuclease (very short patch repair protein)
MASVKLAWIKKYGEEIGHKMWEDRKKLSATTEASMIKKHGEEKGKSEWLKFIKNQQGKGSLDYYTKKHGKEIGTELYYKKNKRLSVGVDTLRRKGLSDEEIREIKSKHSEKSKITKECLIKKYGEIIGTQKWNNKIEKSRVSSKRSLDYWIKYHNQNIELAKKSLTAHQNRDINFYIKKYGEIDGVEAFYEKEKKRFINIKNSIFQIEIEQYVRSITNKKIYGSNNEYTIFLNKEERTTLNKNYIIPDIFIKDLSLVIECYGNFWHCNKNTHQFKNDIHPITKMNIDEHIKLDSLRIEYINKRKIDTLIIWESDWTNNKERIKQIIQNEINKKSK